MGNCLVKKLQTAVEDENLLGLGEWTFDIWKHTTTYNNVLEFLYRDKNFSDIEITWDTERLPEEFVTIQNINNTVYVIIKKEGLTNINKDNPIRFKVSSKYNFNKITIRGLTNICTNLGITNILKYSKPSEIFIVQLVNELLDWTEVDTSNLVYINSYGLSFVDNNIFWNKMANSPKLLNIGDIKKVYWPSENFRPYEYTIFTTYVNPTSGAQFDNGTYLDNFLINMSKCTKPTSISYTTFVISTENCSRSAASNQAIKDLINLGYTIKINGVEQTGDETFE